MRVVALPEQGAGGLSLGAWVVYLELLPLPLVAGALAAPVARALPRRPPVVLSLPGPVHLLLQVLVVPLALAHGVR